jgi:cysteine synthase A
MNDYTIARTVLDKPGRGRVYETILDTVGNTPLVRIGRLAERQGAKLRFLPSWSSSTPRAA